MVAYTATANLTVTANLTQRRVNTTANLLVSASNTAAPKSIQLPYLGIAPANQTNNIVTKRFADTFFRQNALVTEDFIDFQSDVAATNLLIQNDVASNLNALDSNGNRVYPRMTDLTTEANKYRNASSLGVANGVARANTSGSLPLANTHPNIVTDNKAVYYNCITDPRGIVYLTNSYPATSNNPAEYRAATITIPDPGFAYYPMTFVYIQGKSSGTNTSRNTGTGNVGLVTVGEAPPSNNQPPTTIFAQGTCMATPYRNWHIAVPFVNRWTQAAPVRPPAARRGQLILNLYVSNYQGNGYTFYGEGLTWFVILFPTNTPTTA
jgi:hypothetical protein